MKSIFVTGGTGFIGSHTCLLLLENGYSVFILDSLVNSSEKSIAKVTQILNHKGIDTEGKIYLIRGNIKSLDDSKWQALLDFVRKIPEKLSYDIPGNLFSFIGEVGSKLIAQHVLDLTKKVPVIEKELKEYLV